MKKASRAFSFILDELSINYKLIKGELSINNASFEYATILIYKSSIRSKSRASRVRKL